MTQKYRIAADVGGTFTDLIAHELTSGMITIQKVPSTPQNPSIGILNGLRALGVPLKDVDLFSHGTTVGTNALITRNFPPAGLVTTEGFKDVIEIRRGTKDDLWDAYNDVAKPHIPRRNRLGVEERIDYSGKILTPLNVEQAKRIARIFKSRGMKSIAVCFMNAYVNGYHERLMKEILMIEIPDVHVSISSEITPEIFEHERMSTTVINAILSPIISTYLKNLTVNLKEQSYKSDVLVLHSGGGVMTADTAAEFAGRLASSGLAAGAIASGHIARLYGFKNAIGLDMGGTSTDISLMYNDEIRVRKEWSVEYGYPIMFPSIEVLTIGAGGGSLAWIDEGGSLRNGPQSAGASPGPACYGQGGTEVTNTDANVILGRLGTHLLDGNLDLNPDLAIHAMNSKISGVLNMPVEAAANATLKVANSNMCDALRLISVRRGYDPRDFALVVFGGAGPLHGAYLAKEMSISTVIVPPYPGITSALGCLLVDVRHDVSQTLVVNVKDVDLANLEGMFRVLEEKTIKMLESDNIREDSMQLIRQLDMRYEGQWRALTVPVSNPIRSINDSVEIFHREHAREYAFENRDQGIEIYGLRVTAIGTVSKPSFSKIGPSSGTIVAHSYRDVYFEEARGYVSTPVFNRNELGAGAKITGPAIIEQLDSTIVVPPNVPASVDEYGNLIMEIKKED